MNWSAVFGVLLIAFGVAEAMWMARTKARRSFGLQGMILSEIGLIFLARSLIPPGAAQLSVTVLFAAGTFWSIGMLFRAVGSERHEREGL
jgi:hypothetical protein